MIDYTRTRWYGLEYMFRWRGILLPRLLPVMLVSVAISAIVASEVAGDMCDQDSDNPLFQHPYAFQLFGIGFGYLSVARLNISYARYWEGVTQIKIMHSKWADAIIQILAFDRIDRDDTEITEEPFCVHITRLFIQLSALATMHLHEEALPTLEQHHSAMASLHSAEKKLAGMVTSAAGAALHTGKQLGQLGLMRRHSSSPTVGTLGKSKTKPKIEPEKQKKNRQSLLGKFSSKRETMAAEKKAEADGDIRGSYMAEEDLSHHRLFDPEEIALFHAVPDKIHAQISRIIRTITTRQAAGGIKAPPPIVSRVFQELSNGVLAYNNACKMKEVPVPFALVHFNALLLLFFIVTAPLVVSCFTGHLVVSMITSSIVTSGFASLWLVANELEDPFGYDENDVAMTDYHLEFKAALRSSLTHPWLPGDGWRVKEGPWQAPAMPSASTKPPPVKLPPATTTIAEGLTPRGSRQSRFRSKSTASRAKRSAAATSIQRLARGRAARRHSARIAETARRLSVFDETWEENGEPADRLSPSKDEGGFERMRGQSVVQQASSTSGAPAEESRYTV